VQLSKHPSNLYGVGTGGGGPPKPSGGATLAGQSEAIISSYKAVNPSIMNGGRGRAWKQAMLGLLQIQGTGGP
jgi:hypothetical protein